jgi:hypothetical protein
VVSKVARLRALREALEDVSTESLLEGGILTDWHLVGLTLEEYRLLMLEECPNCGRLLAFCWSEFVPPDRWERRKGIRFIHGHTCPDGRHVSHSVTYWCSFLKEGVGEARAVREKHTGEATLVWLGLTEFEGCLVETGWARECWAL